MQQNPFPLGAPIGRTTAPTRVPVPGRPNWFTNGRGGEAFYVEPVKPAAQQWREFVSAGVRYARAHA